MKKDKKPTYKKLEIENAKLLIDISNLDLAIEALSNVRLHRRGVCMHCLQSIIELGKYSSNEVRTTMIKHAISCEENPLVKELKELKSKQ